MASSTNGKRIRQWKGRSPNGCKTCRHRGKKCDEGRPWCQNCVKGGRECDYPIVVPNTKTIVVPTTNTIAVPTTIITSLSLGDLEKETFYKFVNHQSHLLGSFYDHEFWANIVPCVAQGSNQILNATLAVATLYEIPITGTLAVSTNIRKRYQDAIEWYGQSVSTSRTSLISLYSGPSERSDISLLLISTILYLFVELRQIEFQQQMEFQNLTGLKFQNLTSLTRTAFAVLYDSRDTIWSNNYSILLACLAMLIDVSIHLVDSAGIPREHRLFAIKLAMILASESGPSSSLYQLRIELASIVYDLHDLIEKESMDESFLNNEFSISFRICQWQDRLGLYRNTANPHSSIQLALIRLEVLGIMCQVRREFLQEVPDSKMMRIARDQTLDLLDEATQFLKNGTSSIPDFTLETGFVIACIVVAWHWRQQEVLERIENILRALPHAFGMSNFLDRALVYIETLINTPYHEATNIEIILFGAKPKSLLMWQQQRCADYLALLSRGSVY